MKPPGLPCRVVKQVVGVDVDLPGSDADEVIVGVDDAEGVG